MPFRPPNDPVDIPAGEFKTFVIGLSSLQPLEPTDVKFIFAGDNTAQNPGPPVRPGPPSLSGINTLQTSFSSSSVPDIVALALTKTNDGILRIRDSQATEGFAIVGANVGLQSDEITVSAVPTEGVILPVDF